MVPVTHPKVAGSNLEGGRSKLRGWILLYLNDRVFINITAACGALCENREYVLDFIFAVVSSKTVQNTRKRDFCPIRTTMTRLNRPFSLGHGGL